MAEFDIKAVVESRRLQMEYGSISKGRVYCRLFVRNNKDQEIGHLSGLLFEYKVYDCEVAGYVPNGRSAFISNLYVDENERGKGIGSALVRHFDEVSIWFGCDCIEGVLIPFDIANWSGLPDFYKKLGFEVLEYPGLGGKEIVKTLTQSENSNI